MAKMDVERFAFGLQVTRGGVVERQTRIKGDDIAPRLHKLLAGIRFSVRLSGDNTVQHTNLIGAYNQM